MVNLHAFKLAYSSYFLGKEAIFRANNQNFNVCTYPCSVFVSVSLLPLPEPPSPPRSLMAEAISPRSITITFLPPLIWNSMTNQILYNMSYQTVEKGNMAFVLFGALVKRNTEGMEGRLIENLEEDTEYIITVSAVNDFGSSPQVLVQESTKAFISEPAIYGYRERERYNCYKITFMQMMLELC